MPDLGGTLIDIGIGLALVYVVLSLVVSGAQEWVAQITRLRAKNLREGIANLIGDKTELLYEHGLIKGMTDHAKKTLLLQERKYPSYIPSDRFADAFMSVFFYGDGPGDPNAKAAPYDGSKSLTQYIESTIDDPLLKDVLKTLARRADDDVAAMRGEIAAWYDDCMERVAGWYARRIRWIGLAIALVVVISMNADSLRIAHTIWQSEALRTSLATIGESVGAQEQIVLNREKTEEILELLPLGWPCEDGEPGAEAKPPVCVLSNPAFDSAGGFLLKLLGWMITVLAVSLGAPFWFDLLKRVAKLRSGGANPVERSPQALPGA